MQNKIKKGTKYPIKVNAQYGTEKYNYVYKAPHIYDLRFDCPVCGYDEKQYVGIPIAVNHTVGCSRCSAMFLTGLKGKHSESEIILTLCVLPSEKFITFSEELNPIVQVFIFESEESQIKFLNKVNSDGKELYLSSFGGWLNVFNVKAFSLHNLETTLKGLSKLLFDDIFTKQNKVNNNKIK